MPLSTYLLPAATASTVLSTLVALQLIAVPSRNGFSLTALRAHHLPLLLSGLAAAVSAGVATHLALASTRHRVGGTSEEADDTRSDRLKSDKKDKAEKDDKDKSDEAESSGKRWLKKQEIWSESAEDWVEHTRKQDNEDEDDDNEEHKRYLFYVKHRFLPKQPNSEGYVVVQFKRSQHIVDCLRSIIKHAEDLVEDKASVDANELFLAKDQIQSTLNNLRDELEVRKNEETNEAEKDNTESQKDSEDKPESKVPAGGSSADNDKIAVTKAVAAGDAKDAQALTEAISSGSIHEDEDVDTEETKPPTKIPYAELEEKVEHIQILLDFITEHFASIQGKLDRIVPKGMISFKLLWCVIKPGMIVRMNHQASGESHAMILRRCNYRTTMTGEQFFLSGFQLNWQGEKYVRVSASETISAFTGLRKLQSLDCALLTESDRAFFLERGKKYAQYAGPHFMHFEGALITPGPRAGTWLKSRADGRCMIDMSGFRKMNPSQDDWQYLDYDDDDDDDDYYSDNAYGQDSKARDVGLPAQLETLTEDQHFMLTPPTVYGFSFVLKEWGQMLVDSFEDITFDENAYDHLELDADHKTLIRALVDTSQSEHSGKLISDVVQGKGGGIIAVLHGNPGVGKTLTAEAVAELLKRPLYVQGAGDLGVDAATLEHRLRDTLEIARVWKAVVLIDEADIFLEARSHHEISRNAMVGVFLRTLEYQQGILFLTTNRVKSFDEAFLSRFSVAIKYPDLNQERRKKVWSKFLVLAGVDLEGTSPTPITDGSMHTNGTGTPKALITKKDLNRFANEPLNGRVVKQTVRTAQALAVSNGEPLNANHIDQVLRINKKFQEDFESAAPDYAAAGEGWQSRSSLYR